MRVFFSLPQIQLNLKVFIIWNMQWTITSNRGLVSNIDFLLNLSQKSKFWKWLIFLRFWVHLCKSWGYFFHFSALYRSIIWCWHLLPVTITLRCLSAHVQQFEAYSTISVMCMNSVSIWAINCQIIVPVTCKTGMSCTSGVSADNGVPRYSL